MTNPYIILGVPETATDSEIKVALKTKIDTFCGRDLNNKDIEGNYLLQIYNEAAKMLLDKKMREEIDRILADERKTTSLIPIDVKPSIKVDTKEDFISYINVELFENKTFSRITKSKKSSTIINTKRLYLLVGEDNSAIFVWQKCITNGIEHLFRTTDFFHRYSLESVFTGQIVAEHVVKNKQSDYTENYFDGIIFEAGGIKSYIVPACKIIPLEMIEDCSNISANDLADLQNAIQLASREHPQVLKESFKTKKVGNKI